MIDPPQDRDVEGQTTAITTFSTVRLYGRAWLPLIFQVVNRVPVATKRLRELSFIDFARWCLIKELPYNGPPQRPEKLLYPHLFFESNFNGPWAEYIEAFFNIVNRGMRVFWGSSYGFPKPFRIDEFKEYIRRNETEVDHFYVAYDASSTTIQRALALAGTPPSPVTPFMAMCPIRPERREALEIYLHDMDPGPLAKLSRTHMGRWVIVDDFQQQSDQPQEEHLGIPYLVFTVCLDGDVDSYLTEFVVLPETREIFGHCIGCDTTNSTIIDGIILGAKEVKRYLLHNEIKADVFFAAYAATVEQVRDAIERYPESDASWISKTPKVRLHVGRVVREVADQYARERASNPGTLAKRDQHADEYGTIHGRLAVRVDDVPEDLRYGLFAQSGSYSVTVRLSPNKATRWPLCPPVGLAMKVHDVPTSTGYVDQDLILGAENETFFCRGAEEAVDMIKARASLVAGIRYLFPSLNPRRWRLLEARIMGRFMTRRVQDLLAGTTYYSQLPIHCGPDQLVKVSLAARADSEFYKSIFHRPDLARRLRETLADGGTTTYLCLQPMTAEDDPNDPRKQSTGPWILVADVFFPAQEIGNGEDLSFSLANCHPDHEPFGELAEVRVAVYDKISRERHAINAARELP